MIGSTSLHGRVAAALASGRTDDDRVGTVEFTHATPSVG